MVHALETIYCLLGLTGRLIDIHPRGKPTPLYALDDNAKGLLGLIQETDDFIEYRQADAAIQDLVSRNWFLLAQKEVFEYATYANSLEELSEFLTETWSDAVIDAPTWEAAAQMGLAQELTGAKRRLQMVEQVGMSLLLPIAKTNSAALCTFA